MTTPDDNDMALDITLTPPEATGDCPDIWMDPKVAETIGRFARTDTSRELGGVLLGELVTDRPRPMVRVLASIEAKHTEAVSTSVKFTHATWDDIHRVKDEQYPNLRIVGWFHTHPGFGIFLSRWDLFIQHNFFNLPWQIAYVVDPVGHTQGFFRWEAGKVERADRPAEEPARRTGATAAPTPVAAPAPVPAVAVIARAALTAGAFVAGMAVAVAYMSFFRPPRERIVVRTVPAPAQAAAPAHTAAPAAPVKPAPARPVEAAPPARPAGWSTRYTVRPGDTLWGISVAHYGSGGAAEAIRVLNHLDDPDRLPAGTTLLLPAPDLARALSRAASRPR